MTRLLEHQVKSILAEGGIHVPRGELCTTPESARNVAASLGGAVYVKAQAAVGDRAAAGGVRLAGDADEATHAAATILQGTLRGLPVESVLVEEAVVGDWMGYAAVSVDEGPARRVVRFSTTGGAGYDPTAAPFALDLDDATMPYLVRKALRNIGIPSADLVPLTTFLVRLARLAGTWAAYTLELNPVTIVAGEVVALDAKADIDDYSKSLIPEPKLLDVIESDDREHAAREYQASDHRGSLRYVQLISEEVPTRPTMVASHSVGGGESMVALDALAATGLEPTNYCDTSGSPSAEKVAMASRLVTSQSHVVGLLFSTCIANQRLSVTADGLVRGWDETGWRGPTVVRFAGNEARQALDTVRTWSERTGVPVVLLDETSNEWAAAEALADLLRSAVPA